MPKFEVRLESFALVEITAETEEAAIDGALEEARSTAPSWIVTSVDEIKTAAEPSKSVL